MTGKTILRDLAARGVILTANGSHLDVDAPEGALTDELLAELRENKTELLELLTSGHLCPLCAGQLRLQDRLHDTWWCATCRRWSDGQGRPLAGSATPTPKPEPISGDQEDAHKLLEDLLAAGCAFRIEEGELRLQYPSRISAGLWARFENAGDTFVQLARETAESGG